METKKLLWCFKINGGAKIISPNERISKSYLNQAKSSLFRATKNFKEKDLLWATVTLYYAEYYALYSFLQKIGIKSENHLCSILIIKILLGEKLTNIIEKHRSKRIDAQYYMKTGQEDTVRIMLKEAQNFVAYFDNLLSEMNPKQVLEYRDKLKNLLSISK